MQTKIAQRLGLQPFDHYGPPMVVVERRLHADKQIGPEHYLRRAAGCPETIQRSEGRRCGLWINGDG